MLTMAAAVYAANARYAGSPRRSRRRSDASPPSTGRMPMPSTNASAARRPRSTIRPFQYCVETCQICTCCKKTRFTRIRPPYRSTIAPSVSLRDHVARNARPRGPVTHNPAAAIPNEIATVPSCGERTSSAPSETAAAITTSRRRPVASARTISHEQKAYHG